MKTPKSIAVVGGGTAGLVAALILKKRFPKIKLDLIRSSKIGTIGVGEGSTEHWRDFLNHMDIHPYEMFKNCGATCKCGILFQNWGVEDYLHSIQDDFDGKSSQYPYVYANAISQGLSNKHITNKHFWNGDVNKFFLKNTDRMPVNQFHFNTQLLNLYLTDIAQNLGVTFYDDEINDIDLDENGNIDSIKGNKKRYNYDFYIDSTGFKRILIGKMGAKWNSYTEYLRVNSAIVFPLQKKEESNFWTLARAMDNGWLFRIPVQGRYGNGYIFDKTYCTPEQAKKEVEEYFGHEVQVAKHIEFEPGALENVWIKNVCAIGLSASFVEPLEASSIGTTIQQTFLLMHRLINYNEKIIDSYNNDCRQILDNIRDFVALHYITPRKDTQFWKAVSKMPLPESLKNKLEIWKHKMPIREDFCNQSRYILFRDEHFMFILHGLGLFDIKSIKNEYNSLCVLTKNKSDAILQQNELHQDTIATVKHDEYINFIRDCNAY